MVITDVKVRGLFTHKNYKAFVSVTFNHALVIHDIRVNENQGRIYVSMPAKQKSQGYHYDVAHPITNELREKVEAAVSKAYINAKSEL